MRLQDIKDGKIKINDTTSISYGGQVYRGKKAINDLVDRVLPVGEDAKKTSVARESTGNAKATDSAPAAGESSTTAAGK